MAKEEYQGLNKFATNAMSPTYTLADMAILLNPELGYQYPKDQDTYPIAKLLMLHKNIMDNLQARFGK